MAQTTKSDWITFDQRMTEVAGILAAGILRWRKCEMNQMKKHRTTKTFSKGESR
jgi:hypothetical protein